MEIQLDEPLLGSNPMEDTTLVGICDILLELRQLRTLLRLRTLGHPFQEFRRFGVHTGY